MSWDDDRDRPRRRRRPDQADSSRENSANNGWLDDAGSQDPLDDPFADPFDNDWGAADRQPRRSNPDVPPPPPAAPVRRSNDAQRRDLQRPRQARPVGAAPKVSRAAEVRRPRPQNQAAVRQRGRSRPRQGSDYTRPEFYERWDPATYEPIDENPSVERARDAGEWVLVIAAAIAFAFIVQAFALKAYYIPSESMVPTLEINDRVLVNRLVYNFTDIDRGDVVVFDSPPNETDSSIDVLIKRVVATEGQVVSASNGVLYVDGEAVDEEYLPTGTVTRNLPPTSVPEGHLFVMGDNRENSSDSRVFGPIDEDLVIGEAFMKILPVTEIGLL